MHWLLAGCCGLALINISVTLNPAVRITQKPRFYGVNTGRNVGILCLSSEKKQGAKVRWFKAEKYNDEKTTEIQAEPERFAFYDNNNVQNALFFIYNARTNDSGVYFCRIDDTSGPGTAVQITRPVKFVEAQYRTRMKDGLIILQGLVLAVCVAAVLLRKRQLLEKRDSIYEEPETDHIYEGLAIETCGGGLYEELSVYAEAEGAEAPWE